MGHAFCGPAGGSGTLHRMVMQHGAASFQRMHSSNLDTLHSLLERELWRGVPLPPSQSMPSDCDTAEIQHQCYAVGRQGSQFVCST